MSEFVKVCQVSDIPDPGRELFEVDETLVVVAHVDGKFYCIDDVCTHDGGPLSEGPLVDYAIVCPRHGAKFDVRTGRALAMPATEDTASHEVKVEGDDVYVRLCDGDASPSESSATSAPAANTAAAPTATADQGQPSAMPSSGDVNPQAPATAAASGKTLTEDRVREELKQVIDPELFVNIIDLGLVYVVDLQPHDGESKADVDIEMTLTSPMCPAGPQLVANCKQVLGQLEEVGEVTVKIVLDPPWSPDRMTDEARDHLGIF